MKKRSYGKVLTILAVVSFLLTFAEGLLYYESYARFGMLRILLTLQNSIKAFLFNPNLSAERVLGTLTGETSAYRIFIGCTYAAASLLAPLCTATAVFVTAERLMRSQVKRWRIKHKDGILIFGYNNDVKMLIKNQRKIDAAGDYEVINVVTDAVLTEKEEVELMKQNVFISRMDFIYAPEKNLHDYLHSIRSQKIRKIFLLEDSEMKNVSLYIRLCKLSGTRKTGAANADAQPVEFPFAEGAVCCCRCSESYARELINDYYDVEKPVLGLMLFDVSELRVRKALEKNPIWGNRFEAKRKGNADMPAERFDVHILIAGFGRVGEQILLQALNMGVANSESHILIDVVDEHAIHKKNMFFSTLELDKYFISPTELRIYASDERSPADGRLTIRFHDIDARESKFVSKLREVAAEMPFTYAAVCIRNIDVAIRCVSAIEHCSDGKLFPIAVKLEGCEQLAEYLDKNDETYGNVFAIGGVASDEVLSLNDIYDDETEKLAKSYHEIYRNIHFGPADEEFKPGENWEELKLYKQKANRLLHYHSATKEYMLCSAVGFVPKDKAERRKLAKKVLRENLAAVGITEVKEGFHYDIPEDEMLARIAGNRVLDELMRTEHRRWCYGMLFDGWSGDCEKKNEKRRESPYICDWNHLAREMYKYDLVPALMLVREAEEKKESEG